MKITGGIVTFNNKDTIEACIASVFACTKDCDFTLFVADNCSTDGTPELIREKFPQVHLLTLPENKGFGAGHNQILKQVHSDYHVVINPDITLFENTITSLAAYLASDIDHTVGLVTPRILNPDNTEQYLPKYCPTVRYCYISKLPGFHYLRDRYTRKAETFTEPAEIDFCTGCFFMARTRFLKKLGGFNKQFFLYCEDSDLSRRVNEQGRKIIFYPQSSVIHAWHRANTRSIKGIRQFTRSLCIYFKRWGFKF